MLKIVRSQLIAFSCLLSLAACRQSDCQRAHEVVTQLSDLAEAIRASEARPALLAPLCQHEIMQFNQLRSLSNGLKDFAQSTERSHCRSLEVEVSASCKRTSDAVDAAIRVANALSEDGGVIDELGEVCLLAQMGYTEAQILPATHRLINQLESQRHAHDIDTLLTYGGCVL